MDQRKEAIDVHGKGCKTIYEQLPVPGSTAASFLKKYKAGGTVADLPEELKPRLIRGMVERDELQGTGTSLAEQ